MLDHVSITVRDLGRAEPFYDAVMTALGVPRVGRSERWIGYGARSDAEHPERTYISILAGQPVTAGAGHWAFRAGDRETVDRVWAAGLAAGGRDHGRPGLRPDYHADYYAAFLSDPCGNRIEAVCHRRA